jgi:hypothetical protein
LLPVPLYPDRALPAAEQAAPEPLPASAEIYGFITAAGR